MPLISRIRGSISSNRVRSRLSSLGSNGFCTAPSSSTVLESAFEFNSECIAPEPELLSATSSDGRSEEDSDDASCSSTSASSPSSSPRSGDTKDSPFLADPYFDVRPRLEALARQDRDRDQYRSSKGSFHLGEKRQRRNNKTFDNHCHQEPPIPLLIAYTCYLGYATLVLVGHFCDFWACVCQWWDGDQVRNSMPPATTSTTIRYPSEDRRRYANLIKPWENFYIRRLYTRIQDCFNRPIASAPSAHIQVLERVSATTGGNNKNSKSLHYIVAQSEVENSSKHMGRMVNTCASLGPYTTHPITTSRRKHNNKNSNGGVVHRRCLNLGSYNYLGFADDWHTTCAHDVQSALATHPVSTGSSLAEFGCTVLHRQIEEAVAAFVGKPDAICFNMGFNTNCATIPSLVGNGDLVISDSLNHTSIVNGVRVSGASIRICRHNDMSHLEEILREAIIIGIPRTRRPWKKILVIVEGIYSMEGSYCDLKNVVRLCKQYGAYLYLDEAHSIGATGLTGHGCAEYSGVDPADIDIMMGTFTKSFGAMGGYISASKETIALLRHRCAGSVFHNSLSPVVCQQILSSFKVICGNDGTNRGKIKMQALRDNSNYFRMRLKEMGLHVLGNYDSPVIPVMLYNPTKIAAFSRECLKRGLAVVVVGFPAVPILYSRARFCISAGHTRDDLDRALCLIDEVADIVKIRYSRRSESI